MKMRSFVYCIALICTGRGLDAAPFVPPSNSLNDPEAFQLALSLISAQGYRAIHTVSAHFITKSKLATVEESWIDVPTRAIRHVSRRIDLDSGNANPLLNLGPLLAAQPENGFWKTPHGDLAYDRVKAEWKPGKVMVGTSVVWRLRAVSKEWMLWSFVEGSPGAGSALCCGQAGSVEGTSYDQRVKRHANLLKEVESGGSPYSFKENRGLVDEFRLTSSDGVVHWRVHNEYLTEWPFELDEATKREVQKSGRLFFRKGLDADPFPNQGRGYGFVAASWPEGAKVFQVLEKSQAAAAGIAPGDALLSVNGIAAQGNGSNALQHMKDEETATFVLKRPSGVIYSATLRQVEWSVMKRGTP